MENWAKNQSSFRNLWFFRLPISNKKALRCQMFPKAVDKPLSVDIGYKVNVLLTSIWLGGQQKKLLLKSSFAFVPMDKACGWLFHLKHSSRAAPQSGFSLADYSGNLKEHLIWWLSLLSSYIHVWSIINKLGRIRVLRHALLTSSLHSIVCRHDMYVGCTPANIKFYTWNFS